MIVYRIVLTEHANFLHSLGSSGRWNPIGNRIIYTAEHFAVAFAETVIKKAGRGYKNKYSYLKINIPEDVRIMELVPGRSPELITNWNHPTDYRITQSIGDKWYLKMQYCVLKVPSAVLPESFNYLINTLHVDFDKIKIGSSHFFIPDQRVEDMLTKHPKPEL